MQTILILSNHHAYTYNLRKELIQSLIDEGYRVVIAVPYGEKVELLLKMGCEFIDVPLKRRGTNPLSELKLIMSYIKIFRNVKPKLVLTYTLKPNLYGGLVSRLFNIKVLHTVTGLGTVFVQDVFYKKIIILVNRIAFKNSNTIFFMNEDNMKLYKQLKIINSKTETKVVAGSGVNLEEFQYSPQENFESIKFTFIGRILKDKGIEEFLLAAEQIKRLYENVSFEVVGFVDDLKYKSLLNSYTKKGVIRYLGHRNDIYQIIENTNCVVLPSYGEGRGTVLQEGASVGRPLITTDAYGCRDNVEDGLNGYICKVADVTTLTNVMEKFIRLSDKEKFLMGLRSRRKAELEFSRDKVISKYINRIKNII